MTVTALPGQANSLHHAMSASGLVHEATAPLLAALKDTVAAATAQGINDTGARETAAALRDARIALDVAIIAAGRALADREVHIQLDPATAAHGGLPPQSPPRGARRWSWPPMAPPCP